MAVNTDTKKFGLSVEEAGVWRVYIHGYVDEESDTLDWTEMELQCKYCEHNVFLIHSVLIGMLPSAAKTLVKSNSVMMWLVYVYTLNAQVCQWGVCYVESCRLCAVFQKETFSRFENKM